MVLVNVPLARAEFMSSGLWIRLDLETLVRKCARELADDEIAARLGGSVKERLGDGTTDVSSVLGRRLGLVLGCENEVGMRILNDEVGPIPDVRAVLVEVEAIVNVQGKRLGLGNEASHGRNRLII